MYKYAADLQNRSKSFIRATTFITVFEFSIRKPEIKKVN
jgi:hypothetical protein